jgi:hypothetical protein
MTQNDEHLPAAEEQTPGETVVQGGLASAIDESEKECPRCRTASPHDSTTCWFCGYNFTTGEAAASDQSGADLTPAVVARTAGDLPVASGAEAIADGDGTEAQAEPAGLTATVVIESVPVAVPSVVRNERAFRPEDVIYAVDMPEPIAGSGAQGGGVVERAALDIPVSVPGLASARPAPAAAATGPLEVEAGAISIPELDIVHPSVPHAVLVVDYEFRRSRPASITAPAAREPVILELTGEAHSFGRVIRSFCLDFDPPASGLHGHFVRNALGGYDIRDVSTNGTKLNGRYLERDVPTALKDKDVLTLGAWTKIIIYFPGAVT